MRERERQQRMNEDSVRYHDLDLDLSRYPSSWLDSGGNQR